MSGAGAKKLGTFSGNGMGWLTILRALQDGRPRTSRELHEVCIGEGVELTYCEFAAWMDLLAADGMIEVVSDRVAEG